MRQFEYKIERIVMTERDEEDNEMHFDGDKNLFFEDRLNDLGKEGWEVFSVRDGNHSYLESIVVYARREVKNE